MNKKTDKNKEREKPKVHKDLDGFEMEIDSFGELHSNIDIEKINKFLNKEVEDKKLRDRDDIDDLKK